MTAPDPQSDFDFGKLLGQLGGLGGAEGLLRKAQELPARIAQIKEEAAKKSVEVTAGGGVIRISILGSGELVSLRIDPDIVNAEEIEDLEDLILAGVNEANRQARDMVAREVQNATEGLPIPPGMLSDLL